MQSPLSLHRQSRVFLVGLLLIVGVVIWYFGSHWYQQWKGQSEESSEVAPLPEGDVALTELRFFTPKELLSRLDRNEEILFLDIRTKAEYDEEHILDAVSVPVGNLEGFVAKTGQFLVVVSGPDIPNATLKGIHEYFTERKYTFGFLRGSVAEWSAAGGTTLSFGDPGSLYDYTKVLFVQPTEVITLVDELSNPFFIDVREPLEYERSHIPRSVNIPLADLERRRKEIPQGASLFVYGNTDFESYQGGVRLFDLGFYGTRVIQGGFSAWNEQKLPRTPASPAETRP